MPRPPPRDGTARSTDESSQSFRRIGAQEFLAVARLPRDRDRSRDYYDDDWRRNNNHWSWRRYREDDDRGSWRHHRRFDRDDEGRHAWRDRDDRHDRDDSRWRQD